MLTSDGCRTRRQQVLDHLHPDGPLLLGDPLNLRYLANFYADPFNLGADFGGLLLLKPDGHATLFHDHRVPKTVELAHVDERVPIKWYDGKSAALRARRMVLNDVVALAGTDGRIQDHFADPAAPDLWRTITALRRVKGADELDLLRACMRVTEVGHAWARASIKPGMTEFDVYNGVFTACSKKAGQPVIVYGDFVVSPGPKRRTGPPTDRVLAAGDTFILDFSVVIQGYRSDFTNTLVVGTEPTAEQKRLFDLCLNAMREGEKLLGDGTPCYDVYQAMRGVFEAAGMSAHFPHHGGHGLGLSHPESPFIVESATEALAVGDVVTLEPGLYVDGVGGVRIEHNYAITDTGFERLSHHTLSLK